MYSNILVALDGSEASQCALYEAIRIAKAPDSKLRLLHIVHSPMPDYGYKSGASRKEVVDLLCQNGKTILNQAETAARQDGLAPECVLIESIAGPAADVILDQAKQWPASLIVLGTHARYGLSRIGNDTVDILRAALVPVLLVRGTAQLRVGSEHRALDYASVA